MLGGGLGKIGSKIAGTKAGQAILNPIKDSKLFGSMTRGLSSLVNKGATAIGPVMSKISTKLTNLANKIPPDIKKLKQLFRIALTNWLLSITGNGLLHKWKTAVR